jgi:hypothetical protein
MEWPNLGIDFTNGLERDYGSSRERSLGLETMKIIEHSVFEEPGVGYPIGLILFPSMLAARRERNRERIRKKVEAFINEIGVESVLSITEHASTLGPFAVTVWWYRELPDVPKVPDTETEVIRASEESKTAYDFQWRPG